MTTEQKIIGLLQKGYRLTVSNDCGRMCFGVASDWNEWYDEEFLTEDHDGPSVKQLDAMVDRALELVNGRWAKHTAG